ncbi:LOW QUALITY PROTEIN: WD repeat-containing protein 27 [Aegotheles albertisi]
MNTRPQFCKGSTRRTCQTDKPALCPCLCAREPTPPLPNRGGDKTPERRHGKSPTAEQKITKLPGDKRKRSGAGAALGRRGSRRDLRDLAPGHERLRRPRRLAPSPRGGRTPAGGNAQREAGPTGRAAVPASARCLRAHFQPATGPRRRPRRGRAAAAAAAAAAAGGFADVRRRSAAGTRRASPSPGRAEAGPRAARRPSAEAAPKEPAGRQAGQSAAPLPCTPREPPRRARPKSGAGRCGLQRRGPPHRPPRSRAPSRPKPPTATAPLPVPPRPTPPRGVAAPQPQPHSGPSRTPCYRESGRRGRGCRHGNAEHPPTPRPGGAPASFSCEKTRPRAHEHAAARSRERQPLQGKERGHTESGARGGKEQRTLVAFLSKTGIVTGTLSGMVLDVRFSLDDQQVAVCAGNRIYMLSAKNEDILAELNGHLAPVTTDEFCTWEKNMLVSVSEDRTSKVWDYSSGQLIYQSGVLTAFSLLSLLIDEENKQIITGCAEGQLWIFSLISDHNYRCMAHINLKKEQEKFYNKVWKFGKEIGEGRNTSNLCKTNNMRLEGSVETSLPILLIEHCDFLVCFHNEENVSSALTTSYFWIGSSTGLLIINLANFELEGFLSKKEYSDLSIQFAKPCALTRKTVNRKVLCFVTSVFEDMIAVLEVNLAALVRTQQSDFLLCGNKTSLSVTARCSLLANSQLCNILKKNLREPSSKTLGLKSTVKDQPLVFHNKIKSSGYTVAPQMTIFSPKNNLKKNKVSKWKTSYKCRNKEYPLESYPPIKYEKEISVTCKPTAIYSIQYFRDREMLACGLADKTVLIFSSNLTDTYNVFSGHDGAVNSVGWSHDKKWLVSASEDRTLRVWSVCNNEPAPILGKEKFHKTVRFAQFYFIDAFILLCCGAEFHLLSFHLDTTKDDLKRSKQRSVCKLVQNFPMASTMKITSLSAVNVFYSYNLYIVLTAGSNRALEVFDLNAGCSTAVIPEVHSRAVHQICQNKGSSFSTQLPEVYNLFITTAAGDDIKLWDLRTLKCERRFEGHSSCCYPCGIALSPCGRFIASGSDDKYAYIYEIHSSTFSHKLERHTESVINVTFRPSFPQLTTATLDGKLHLFLP